MADWTLRRVKAKIDYDFNAGGIVPKIVIGNKEYSWLQFGKELMTYEGWKLEFKIIDRYE